MLQMIADRKYFPIMKSWLEPRLNYVFDEDTKYFANVVVEEDGSWQIVFCVAFANWAEHSCEAFAASDGSRRQKITGEFWNTIFDYVFNAAGKNCIYSHVRAHNEKSVALHGVAGFNHNGVLEGYYGPDQDAIIFGLTRQHWLDGKWGTEYSKGAE